MAFNTDVIGFGPIRAEPPTWVRQSRLINTPDEISVTGVRVQGAVNYSSRCILRLELGDANAGFASSVMQLENKASAYIRSVMPQLIYRPGVMAGGRMELILDKVRGLWEPEVYYDNMRVNFDGIRGSIFGKTLDLVLRPESVQIWKSVAVIKWTCASLRVVTQPPPPEPTPPPETTDNTTTTTTVVTTGVSPEAMVSLDSRLVSTNENVARLASQVTTLENTLNSTIEDVVGLKTTSAVSDGGVDAIQQSVAIVNSRVSLIENSVVAVGQEVSDLRTQLSSSVGGTVPSGDATTGGLTGEEKAMVSHFVISPYMIAHNDRFIFMTMNSDSRVVKVYERGLKLVNEITITSRVLSMVASRGYLVCVDTTANHIFKIPEGGPPYTFEYARKVPKNSSQRVWGITNGGVALYTTFPSSGAEPLGITITTGDNSYEFRKALHTATPDGSRVFWSENAYGITQASVTMDPSFGHSTVPTVTDFVVGEMAASDTHLYVATEGRVKKLRIDGTSLTQEQDIPIESLRPVKFYCSATTDFVIANDGNLYFRGEFPFVSDTNAIESTSTFTRVEGVSSVRDVRVAFNAKTCVALTWGGDVYEWNTSTENRHRPRKVLGNAKAIATSNEAALALTTEGTVYAWGASTDYCLGKGSAILSSAVPLVVDLGGDTVTAIQAGTRFCAALTSSGRVYTWGASVSAYLGRTQAPDYLPGLVQDPTGTGTLEGITDIACGYHHMLALSSTGQVYAWGRDVTNLGILGDQATERAIPTLVVYPGDGTPVSGIQSIACVQMASAALKTNGDVVIWGSHDSLLKRPRVADSGVTGIYSDSRTNIYITKSNGTTVVWGYPSYPVNDYSLSTVYPCILHYPRLQVSDGKLYVRGQFRKESAVVIDLGTGATSLMNLREDDHTDVFVMRGGVVNYMYGDHIEQITQDSLLERDNGAWAREEIVALKSDVDPLINGSRFPGKPFTYPYYTFSGYETWGMGLSNDSLVFMLGGSFIQMNYDYNKQLEVLGATHTGFVYTGTGTSSVPTYSFKNDTNTGIYSAGPDTIGITCAGFSRVRISYGNFTCLTPNASFYTASFFNISCVYDVRCRYLYQSSDSRLKDNVAPLGEGSLDRILQLKGVTYEMKSDPGNKKMGLIAQDVEKVFPEVVKADDGGYLSLAYSDLIAPLIEALREVNDSLKLAHERISALESAVLR